MNFLDDLLNLRQFEFSDFGKSIVVLLLGTILLGICGRFVFGKRSNLNHAVSSSFIMLQLYVFMFGTALCRIIPQPISLPFLLLSNTSASIRYFDFSGITPFCAQLVFLIGLTFLINFIEGFFPKGSTLMRWIILRILSVLCGIFILLSLSVLIDTHMITIATQYAVWILLGIGLLMLLTGILKILVGATIATFNPVLGAIYTFFFANIVGKHLSRAIITAMIITGIFTVLHFIGIHTIPINHFTAPLCIALSLLLSFLWRIAMHTL